MLKLSGYSQNTIRQSINLQQAGLILWPLNARHFGIHVIKFNAT